LEWNCYYEDADTLYIDILYKEENDTEYTIIDTVQNNNFYHWIVPDEINPDAVNIDIIIPPLENSIVHTLPVLKLYPDPNSRIIDESNVLVISKGLFFVEDEKTELPAIASYIDPITEEVIEHPIIINLLNGMVDESNPVHMEPFIYNAKVPCKHIELAVRAHNEDDSYSFIQNNEDVNNWISVV
jgi:hypothetical protein